MIGASEKLYNYFNQNIREEGQEIEIKITKGEKVYTITDDDLVASSVKITKKSVSGASFDIGECYVDSVTFTINKNINNYKSLTGAKVTIRIKVNNTELNISESVLLGTFRILQDGIKRTNTLLQVTADSYISRFDKSRKRATFTGDLYDLVMDSCNKCKVTFGMTENEFRALSQNVAKTYDIKKDSSLKTHRDVIMYVAQLIGGFATTTTSGALIFKNYTSNNDVCNVNDNVIVNYSIGDEVYNLSGLGMSVKENDVYLYREGEDDDSPYFLNLDTNPIMENCTDAEITSIVDNIWSKLIDLNLNNFSFEFNGNPFIEVGDIISIPERSLETYVASCEWTYHGKEKISCVSVDKNKRIETQREKQNENKPSNDSKDNRVDDLIKNTTTKTRKVRKTVTGTVKGRFGDSSINSPTIVYGLNDLGENNARNYNYSNKTNYTYSPDYIRVGYIETEDNKSYFKKIFTLEPAVGTVSLFNSGIIISGTDMKNIIQSIGFDKKNVRLELDLSSEYFDIYNFFYNQDSKSTGKAKPPALTSGTTLPWEEDKYATYQIQNTTSLNLDENYLHNIINSKGSCKVNLNYNKNILFSGYREPSDNWSGNYSIKCDTLDVSRIKISAYVGTAANYYYDENSRKVVFEQCKSFYDSDYDCIIKTEDYAIQKMQQDILISGYGTYTEFNNTKVIDGEQERFLTFLSDITLEGNTYVYTENPAYTAMKEKEKELLEIEKTGINIPYKLTYETEESYTTTIEGTSNKINENTDKTDENADEIEKLKTNVKKNTVNIDKLKQQVTSSRNKIGIMSNDLGIVKTNIADLDKRVKKLEGSGGSSGGGMTDAQKKQLEQNTKDISTIKTNVANNTKNISTNKTNIDNLTTRVTNLEEGGSSGSGITEAERQQIQTNKEDITNLTTNVSNNTNNISTNTTNITRLTTRVTNLENSGGSGGSGSGITEAERQQIQTNKTDIVNLTTRVTNLENSGGSGGSGGSDITEAERQQIQTNKTNIDNLTLTVNGHTESIEDILRRLTQLEQGGGGDTGDAFKFIKLELIFKDSDNTNSYVKNDYDFTKYFINDSYYFSDDGYTYYRLKATLNKTGTKQTFRNFYRTDGTQYYMIGKSDTTDLESATVRFTSTGKEYLDCISKLDNQQIISPQINVIRYNKVSASSNTSNWYNVTTGNTIKTDGGVHIGDTLRIPITVKNGFKALSINNKPEELNKYWYAITTISSPKKGYITNWTELDAEPNVETNITFTYDESLANKNVYVHITDGQYATYANYLYIKKLT